MPLNALDHLKILLSAMEKRAQGRNHIPHSASPSSQNASNTPHAANQNHPLHKDPVLLESCSYLALAVEEKKWKPSYSFLTILQNLAATEFYESLFNTDSILDLQANKGFYQLILRFLVVTAKHTSTRTCLFSFTLIARLMHIKSIYDEQNHTSLNLIEDSELYQLFVQLWSSLPPDNVGTSTCSTACAHKSSKKSNIMNSKQVSRGRKASSNAIITSPPTPHRESKGPTPKDAGSIPTKEPSKGLEESLHLVSNYASALKDLQFGEQDLSWSHHFIKCPAPTSLETIQRIAHELVSLTHSLPLSPSGSIFLRYDPDRIYLMRALITGPEDTPYESGCFIFDLYIPPSFPEHPPLVHFVTGAKNRQRFNPNLYDDGKVCLSLLGTWAGRPSENWNHDTSTLLQVLISIQGLILCKDPYFNEPGYELSRNTADAQSKSAQYSKYVTDITLAHAVRDWFKHAPSNDFDRIARFHISQRSPKTLATPSNFSFALDTLS